MPPTQKAYRNLDFLASPPARTIRMLCEYEEPRQRFLTEQVRDTVVIFGSARIKAVADSQALLDGARAAYANTPTKEADEVVKQAERVLRISRYYDDTRALAAKLTAWSMARERQYLVCSGGGPGIMEAANRGAADVPGGRSVALGISLPFEEKVNPYATPELAFEFHYFFMRKYWFAYLAKAMVIMPGGFGTLDELAEILTLRQTGKIKKRLPMVLFGKAYWESVLNLEALVDWGTISAKDLDLMHYSDDVDDAFAFLTNAITENEDHP